MCKHWRICECSNFFKGLDVSTSLIRWLCIEDLVSCFFLATVSLKRTWVSQELLELQVIFLHSDSLRHLKNYTENCINYTNHMSISLLYCKMSIRWHDVYCNNNVKINNLLNVNIMNNLSCYVIYYSIILDWYYFAAQNQSKLVLGWKSVKQASFGCKTCLLVETGIYSRARHTHIPRSNLKISTPEQNYA